MNDPVSVLVVGAGPVGLSAALALTQAGVAVRVVDAASDIDRRMRASTFHPPTLDMIATLGLSKSLTKQGLPVPRFQMRQHESGEHVTFDLTEISDATDHPFRLQVEQHHYCELAIEALAKLGVDVKFDTAVESIAQDDDIVTASLHNGKTSAKWLIGADGSGSAVRKSLGLDYGGRTYTHSSVLASTPFPFHQHLEDISDVSYCWSGRGPFSLLRLRNFWRVSLYPGVEDLTEAASRDRVYDWLTHIHPAARDAELLNVSPYRVHERCVDRFRMGRVFLAGDAAHLNPPSGGLGMNGGIHDAMNLSRKLLQVLNGAEDKLLDQYDRQRRNLACKRIIPQAAANRARMSTTGRFQQLDSLKQHRIIASDKQALREFLLQTSMISGLREAEAIE
ncbi:MAG: FAD-dependent oxidoreductase [Woeseiaceae bacterium]